MHRLFAKAGTALVRLFLLHPLSATSNRAAADELIA
jgi:hypothetical protein